MSTPNSAVNSAHKPTLLVMAGGTGGHIFPGLAVADRLKQQGWQIHWLGTPDRMEADLVPEHGYDISFINISGLRKNGLLSWIKLPFKLCAALYQSIRLIKKINPDVVLGMGGYASAPGGLAAWLLRKPLVVHEQNAAAGLSNRLLSHIATQVCCAFPNAFHPKVDAQVVGNPLRSSIGEQLNKELCDDKDNQTQHNILVIGGSLGAQVLNQIVPPSFIQLTSTLAAEKTFNICHQTGKGNKDAVLAAYQQQPFTAAQIQVTEFIKDMASSYQWADVVICRAGALTVSELAMAATPAIFIPLPHAVDDHQTKNAQYLVARGGAKLIKQQELTVDCLVTTLTELFAQPQILAEMAKAALAAADLQATRKVANICQQLLPAHKTNLMQS